MTQDGYIKLSSYLVMASFNCWRNTEQVGYFPLALNGRWSKSPSVFPFLLPYIKCHSFLRLWTCYGTEFPYFFGVFLLLKALKFVLPNDLKSEGNFRQWHIPPASRQSRRLPVTWPQWILNSLRQGPLGHWQIQFSNPENRIFCLDSN